MNLVMGVDSGGTKTLLALANRQGDLAGYWQEKPSTRPRIPIGTRP
ncbi:hypothetical protein SODG_006868 [Sodalis praecaptivus]